MRVIARRPRTGPARWTATETADGVSTSMVRRRRGVVVGVAEVAAVHDAADPVRDNAVGRLEPKRAVVADRDAQQAVRHRSPVTLHADRVLRLALILHRPDGGPAERRRRDRCGERAPRSRHDPDPPRVVRGRAHRGGHLRTQPVHVEPRGVGIRVDLERHRAAIDPVAVPCVVEHLSTVEAAEQVVDLVAAAAPRRTGSAPCGGAPGWRRGFRRAARAPPTPTPRAPAARPRRARSAAPATG